MYIGWEKGNDLSDHARNRIVRYLLKNGEKDPYFNLVDNWTDYAKRFYPDNGDYTKDQIANLVLKRMPETVVESKDLTFGGDMREISVAFEKVRQRLGFQATCNLDDGVREGLYALRSGLIQDPQNQRYRNAQFIVQ